MQDCSISSALAMEILQSCTKPDIMHVLFSYRLVDIRSVIQVMVWHQIGKTEVITWTYDDQVRWQIYGQVVFNTI